MVNVYLDLMTPLVASPYTSYSLYDFARKLTLKAFTLPNDILPAVCLVEVLESLPNILFLLFRRYLPVGI